MRTLSIVTLSLSPVGLLLLYGPGNVVSGASESPSATHEPEAATKNAQPELSPPTPGPVETRNQVEFSTTSVYSQPALQLPAPTNQSATLNQLPLNQPVTPTEKFEIATIQVDATKLDRIITRSFRGDTNLAPMATTVSTPALPVASAENSPQNSPQNSNAIAVSSVPSASVTPQLIGVAIDSHSRPDESSTTPAESSPLEAIQFIAASGVAVPATFQLAPVQLNGSTDRLTPSALTGEFQDTASSQTTNEILEKQPTPQSSPAEIPAIAQTSSPNSTPNQSPTNSTNGNESYILGAGDIVQISFFNVPEYNGQVQVMPDGTINLPVVGSVPVSGLTLKQAGEAIGSRYTSELQYSVVSVYLVQPRPLQIALVGEITQPGLYNIPANQNGQFPAVVQAIQTAGGATQSANLQQVEIRRKDQAGTMRTMTVNLLALLQQGDLSQNSLLQDGDVIFIPATSEVNLADANQLAISNLRSTTNTPLDISIVGEVSRPGPYRLEATEGRSTLVQAIQQAGGFTPTADLSQIQLRRKTRQGAEQLLNINLWQLLQTGDLAQDLVLQQGDTVLIPTARELTDAETAALTASSLSTGTIQVNILGEVESPGAQQLQANTTLNQAVLAAGGFNGRAKGEVKLIRFNPNGTLTQRRIDVDLTQELNSETNPILHSNDVIVVGRSTGAIIRDSLSEAIEIFQLISPLPFVPF